ncbi:MAG: hypothetical protein WDN06_09445 [Asticcacaulis sp.]
MRDPDIRNALMQIKASLGKDLKDLPVKLEDWAKKKWCPAASVS